MHNDHPMSDFDKIGYGGSSHFCIFELLTGVIAQCVSSQRDYYC